MREREGDLLVARGFTFSGLEGVAGGSRGEPEGLGNLMFMALSAIAVTRLSSSSGDILAWSS